MYLSLVDESELSEVLKECEEGVAQADRAIVLQKRIYIHWQKKIGNINLLFILTS